MELVELIKPIYDFALMYAEKLAADIPEEQMCAQPVAGKLMNHAAWILGHLAQVDDGVIKMLGGEPKLSAWKEKVGQGSVPVGDRAAYPSKAELLAALKGAHERLLAALREATPATLDAPSPERMRTIFPTTRHMLTGLMTAHQASHLGQLSAWRRAMGYGSAF